MAAQVVQAPPSSVAPLAQEETHTLLMLLVCEQPTFSAPELHAEPEQAVHVVASAR